MMFVLKSDMHCAEWFTFSTQWSNWKQKIYDIQTMTRK